MYHAVYTGVISLHLQLDLLKSLQQLTANTPLKKMGGETNAGNLRKIIGNSTTLQPQTPQIPPRCLSRCWAAWTMSWPRKGNWRWSYLWLLGLFLMMVGYHLMIRAKMKTHWVSLNFRPAIKPLWYVKGGTGTLRGGVG